MRQTKTKALVETAFLTAIIVVLALIGTNVPMLGVFSSILVPATIAIVGIRWGAKYALASVVVEFFILSMVIGPVLALIESITFSGIGILLGYGHEKQWGTGRLLLIPSIYFALSMAILVVGAFYLFNIDIVGQFMAAYQQSMDMVDTMGTQGLYTPDQVTQSKALMGEMIDVLKKTAFLLAFMSGAVVSFCSSKIASLILGRIGYPVKPLAPCRDWRVPRNALYILLLGIVIQVWSTYRPMEILYWLGPNLYMLGATLCVIQGFGTLWSIMESYKLGSKIRFIIAIVAVLIFSTYLIFLGIFDLFFDLRTRIKNRVS